MKHLRHLAALLFVIFLSGAVNTTPLMAQTPDDNETRQFPWDFIVSSTDIYGHEHEIPDGIVSAYQAFDTGMAALLRYFPQFEQDFLENVRRVNMYYRDPARWQARHTPGSHVGSAAMLPGIPPEPIKWMGIVWLNSGHIFVFSTIPQTGELVGVQHMTSDNLGLDYEGYEAAFSYRACNSRIFEIVELATQIAYEGDWINGQISSITILIFDSDLKNTSSNAQLARITLLSLVTEEPLAWYQVDLTFRTYDMELISIHNSALSVGVMAQIF